MKSVKLYLSLLLLISSFYALQARNGEIDDDIKKMVQGLTLDQKVGQMMQIDIDIIMKQNSAELDEDQIRYLVKNYNVGSFLDSPFSGGPIGGQYGYTTEQWRKVIRTIQNISISEGAKIPMIFGLDSVHGANYVYNATIFPQQIAGAATFNTTLLNIQGKITAKDTRNTGIPWLFSPILGISQEPRWPRVFETFGEDPYLASQMGQAIIEGIQSGTENLAAAACMKHFIGYPVPRSGHDRTPSWIPDRILYQYFVPPFRAAINAGVMTAMESYNEVNGVPLASSHQYLVELLRDTLGFKGMLVTDYKEIENLNTWHRIAATPKDAVRISINSTSIDMSMIPLDTSFSDLLLQLVKEKSITPERIDSSVERVLQLKKDLGLLDNPFPPENPITAGCKEDREAALNVVRESVTLLKNMNQTLPLTLNHFSQKKSILVTGPTANSLSYQSGGWTLHWQGANFDEEFPFGTTILQGIQNRLEGSNVTVLYDVGCAVDGDCDQQQLKKAVADAALADLAIICIGEGNYAEKPGDIDDLTLSSGQQQLVREIQATGIPTILILVEGRPRVLNGIDNLASAILHAYLPGPEGGVGIAEILFGDVNPSGRLPITYPRSTGAIPLQYYRKYSEQANYNPQWEFGTGLSYTTFQYSNLQVEANSTSGEVLINVTVQNVGKRAGKEVVLVYTSNLYRIITPEVKMLRRFHKVELQAGESKNLHFNLTSEDFIFYGLDNRLQLEGGDFTAQVGPLAANFTIHFTPLFDLQGSQCDVKASSTGITPSILAVSTVGAFVVGGLLVATIFCIVRRKSQREYTRL